MRASSLRPSIQRVLHLLGLVGEPGAAVGGVVEVELAGTHRAKTEGQPRLQCLNGRVYILGEEHSAAHLKVDVCH